MGSVRYPQIGGIVLRYTRTDKCGRPLWGDRVRAASKGFVSVAQTANYADGTEISRPNANGDRCVYRPARPQFNNFSLVIEFCNVEPELYGAMTGQRVIYDPRTGLAIGFTVDSDVSPMDVAGALELWSDANNAAAGCDPNESEQYGYNLWPLLTGGRIGAATWNADNSVTFIVDQALTRDGSGWGVGPYLVMTDADDELSPLVDPILPTEHWMPLLVDVAPPEPWAGLLPLDNPDRAAATSAVAGIPGTWNDATGPGGKRPYTLADLEEAEVTASPSTSWTTGQHVILGDGTEVRWNGTDWIVAE